MTVVFWAVIALMTVAALSFILLPLLKTASPFTASRRETNIAIYRERSAEIQAAVDRNTISAADAGALRQEIERRLVSEATLQETTATPAMTGRSRYWLPAVLILLLPALAISLYIKTGDWQLSIAGGGLPAADILVDRLADHLKQQPDDAEGWLLLARASAALQKYPEAANAYARFNALTGPSAENLVSEAEMRALAADGSLQGRPSELVARALALAPEFGRALWYSGLIAYQSGDRRNALGYWRRLSSQDLPDDFRKLLDEHIAQADGKPPGSVHTSSAQKPAGLRLPVHVMLDPHLAAQLKPDTAVFIYAKAVEGPPMPLAVVRRRVADLPLDMELDDSMAVMDSRKLSDYSRWIVTARVALRGSAEAQPGDLYAEQQVVRTNPPKTVQLNINRSLP